MNTAYAPALEFLTSSHRIDCIERLQDGFAQAVAPFGITHFNCMHVADPGRPLGPRVLFGRSNEAWDSHYMERGYLRHDPCVGALFSFAGPYAWSDVAHLADKAGLAMFEEARGAGAAEGLVVPIHTAGGGLSAVRMISAEPRLDAAARPTLHALAVVLATCGASLVERSGDDAAVLPGRLSPREAECLAWVGEGKSDWDIGEIVGISEATVHWHVENAKRKLGVRSRVQAYALALMRGLLTHPR